MEMTRPRLCATIAEMPEAWSQSEVELIVQDYFTMLASELHGELFNKAQHRRELMPLLQGRTEASIERKHQNISAVLGEMGFPFVDGYKPLRNYQRTHLPMRVSEALTAHPSIVRTVEAEVDQPVTVPSIADILGAMQDAPRPSDKVARNAPPLFQGWLQGNGGINYLERESHNRSLGSAGEEFVVNYERARLSFAGKDRLAESVEWVSRTEGDGTGYDVLSFEKSGRERFIEVKTTQYGRYTPFFVSRNELRFCDRHREAYRLYRVFAFKSEPKMFSLKGSIEDHCRLDPTEYRASLI